MRESSAVIVMREHPSSIESLPGRASPSGNRHGESISPIYSFFLVAICKGERLSAAFVMGSILPSFEPFRGELQPEQESIFPSRSCQ